MRTLLFLLTLLSGCAAKTTAVPASGQVLNADKCLSIFDNILTIQAARSKLSEELLQQIQTAEGEEAVELRREWLDTENKLRTKVTGLYDLGYKKGCF